MLCFLSRKCLSPRELMLSNNFLCARFKLLNKSQSKIIIFPNLYLSISILCIPLCLFISHFCRIIGILDYGAFGDVMVNVLWILLFPSTSTSPVYSHASVDVFTRSRHSFPHLWISVITTQEEHPDDDFTPDCPFRKSFSSLLFSTKRQTYPAN